MNEIDKKILNHICCDYSYNPLWNEATLPLFEEMGYVPKINEYVAGFQEFIRKKIFPQIEYGGTYWDEIKSPSVFGVENPFFTTCEISIIASIRDGGMAWNSYYDQDSSFYSDISRHVVIKITAGASDGQQLMGLLCNNFSHELTHAYDDCQATLKNGTNLKDANEKSLYNQRTLIWRFGSTSNQKMLGRALYYLSPIERNAIIGQIRTEIQNISTSTPQKAFEAVKNTLAYKTYIWLKKCIEKINTTDDRLVQEELLSAYTKWMGYNKHHKKNPDVDYITRDNLTYEGFLKEINNMFRKWERKFLTMAGKIAYSQYLQKELPLVNSYSIDEGIYNKSTLLNEGFEKERTYTYGVNAYPVDNEKN